jgi:hypothetical protein
VVVGRGDNAGKSPVARGEGLHTKFVYSIDRKDNKLTITLPEEVAKRIGNRLSASFKEGEIVISEVKE